MTWESVYFENGLISVRRFAFGSSANEKSSYQMKA